MSQRRRYVYISVVRINERIGQMLAEQPRWRRRVAGGGLQILGSGFNYELASADEREAFHRDIAAIEKDLAGKTGTVDRPDAYFYGRIPLCHLDFDKVTPAVAYFAGKTERTALMLAGPLDRLVGRHRDDAKSRDDARQISYEPGVAVAVAEGKRRADQTETTKPLSEAPVDPMPWPEAVLATHEWCVANPAMEPKEMEFLARQDARAEIGISVQPEHALIGKPLYVAELD